MISIHGDGAELRATAQTRPCLRVARATHPVQSASRECYNSTCIICFHLQCVRSQCYNLDSLQCYNLLHANSHSLCNALCCYTINYMMRPPQQYIHLLHLHHSRIWCGDDRAEEKLCTNQKAKQNILQCSRYHPLRILPRLVLWSLTDRIACMMVVLPEDVEI